MNRLFLTLLLCLTMLPLRSLRAEVWTPESLPMVHLQDARRYVCNPDGVLSPAVTDSIDALLFQLEQEKGIQTVVVVVKQLKDGDCYTFGMDLGRRYGIGSKKQQSGLIVILSTEDRKYQILTGFGLEGALPDAICKRVENLVMVPYLKQENWDQAMLQGTKAISGYLEGDKSLMAESQEEEGSPAGLFLLLFFLVVFFVAIMLNKGKGTRVCPRCQKKTLRPVRETFLYTQGQTDFFRVVYVCSHCKYTETRIERRFHRNDGSGALAAGLLGGMLLGRGNGGGGFGGGDFGGGSFGGGGFGGGGAGGGF